jgi:hypothetical protein
VTARELTSGMVLVRRTGAVLVLKRTDTHGGVEALVAPVGSRAGAKAGRLLWFWPGQTVEVVAADAPPRPARGPGGAQAVGEAHRGGAAANEAPAGAAGSEGTPGP